MQTTERFEKVDIDRLVPYARNARTHSKEQILQLRSSLREFGFVNPIIVDKDLNIIAGHGRVLAAKAEGLVEVPCVFAEHLTEAQKRAYIIADNRLALNAGWDEELLALEFAELKDLGFDLELTGFDEKEIEKLFAGEGGDAQDDDFDLTAALEEAAFVLPGDVWTLGRHRLICGDATDAATVRKLMDGRKANLVLTAPHYAVSYKSATGLSIKNDNMKAEEFYEFLLSSFRNLAESLENGGSAYIFHSDTEGESFRRAFREAGFHLSGTCIWVKDSFVMGRAPYHWQHEPCQPTGTMVLTVNGAIPIESLTDLDRVISYDSYSGQIVGFRVGYPIRTASRQYSGKMRAISCKGCITRATPEHLFSVRFASDTRNLYCTYIMRRGDWWRIGHTRTYMSRGFGLKDRMRMEKADEAWILKTFQSEHEALMHEQLMSCKFGIPQTHWTVERGQRRKDTHRTEEDVRNLYAGLDLEELRKSACLCLTFCDRDARFPLIDAETQSIRFSTLCTTRIRACNLISGIMQLPIPNSAVNGSFSWESVDAITTENYTGKVYSLAVEPYAHYVADGIVTHNCLFGWRKNGTHQWYTGRSESTVWNFPKPKRNNDHPTSKPIDLLAYPIRNSSQPNGIVLDTFGGSGSALIACEQTDRVCHMLELDEKYASVILRRYAEYKQNSGEDITCERGGQTLRYADLVREVAGK